MPNHVLHQNVASHRLVSTPVRQKGKEGQNENIHINTDRNTHCE